MFDDTARSRSLDLKFYGFAGFGCEHVSFELWPGEVLALVGVGIGQTTRC